MVLSMGSFERYYTDGTRNVTPGAKDQMRHPLPNWIGMNLGIFLAVWIAAASAYAVTVEETGWRSFIFLAALFWPFVLGSAVAELIYTLPLLLPGLLLFLIAARKTRPTPNQRPLLIALGPLATSGAILAAPSGDPAWHHPVVIAGFICTGLLYGAFARPSTSQHLPQRQWRIQPVP